MMAEAYHPGDTIESPETGSIYTIKEAFPPGNYAMPYVATDDKGKKIFLKVYKDPTAESVNFDKFCEQQKFLMELFKGKDFVEETYETFILNNAYLVVAKEYMVGKDLETFLNETDTLDLNSRLLIATVCSYALKKVHELGVIHCDLKPQQIYLEEKPELEMKYKVKIVDFDFSRIPGKYEPFYAVTTRGYSAPEYFKKQTIDFKSDVFTMGIILYFIITGCDPYDCLEEEYETRILNYMVKEPAELLPSPDMIPSELSKTLYRMLDPDINNRPTMEEVHSILLKTIAGELSKESEPPSKPAEATEPQPSEATPPSPAPASAKPESAPPSPSPVPTTTPPAVEKKIVRVELYKEGTNFYASFHKTTLVNRDMLRILGEGYEYVDNNPQFLLEKKSKGWSIKGLEGTVNPTHLNGENIVGVEKELKDGDIILIGNSTTNEGLKMEVRLIPEENV